jgi:succinylglutamic semialdehyde dehydrogenase
MFKGNFINGEFVKVSKKDESWTVTSPADFKDEIAQVEAQYSHLDEAVEAARSSFKTWSKLSLQERIEHLERLKEVYLSKKEQIAELISRETGKPNWETLGEAGALAGKIDITIKASLDLVKDIHVEAALPGMDGYIKYRPRGVMAVLGPFNFPGHLPNGHFVPALLTGNTVVFKPSEMTPMTGQLLAECIEEAGLPEGVFNLVQGGAEIGKRLVAHENVDSVLFTGSYEVGLSIKQSIASHYWKNCALEMGGKNTSIVWNDANMDQSVYQNIFGAFASTGQRCSCTSRIILHDDIHDEFVERYYQTAKTIKIGHWKEDVFMGPLINAKSVEKFLRFQEIAKREGAENIMRGKALELEHQGHYVTPSLNLIEKTNPSSVYEKEEIFGPNVAIYKASDLDEAIALANDTSYGLSGAIFSKDRSVYEKVASDFEVGLLNWNRATCGASSKLPFGGLKKSGNAQPSAHFAVYYCTTPVAYLEGDTEFDPKSIARGMELK